MSEFEPEPLPEGYVCPEGTVPGWLNTDGLPTSCVGDLPLVEPRPEPSPSVSVAPPIAEFPEPLPLDPLPPEIGVPQVVAPSTPRELAETGPVDLLTAIVFGVILILAGVATWLTGRK